MNSASAESSTRSVRARSNKHLIITRHSEALAEESHLFKQRRYFISHLGPSSQLLHGVLAALREFSPAQKTYKKIAGENKTRRQFYRMYYFTRAFAIL